MPVVSTAVTKRPSGRIAKWPGLQQPKKPSMASRERWAAAVAHVRALDDTAFRDFHGRRLVEAAIDLICAYLLLRAAQRDARKLLVARYFVEQMNVRVEGAAQAVLTSTPASLDALQALGRD